MTEQAALLLAGLSARALAFAARRAGYAAIAFDAFGDDDTRAACRETVVLEDAMGGFAGVDLTDAVANAARKHAAIGLVYGSGFDDCPQRLAAVAGSTAILGAPPEAMARAKHPKRFAIACAEAEIAHPEIAFATPRRPSEWLVKRRGGSGGLHIREANGELRPGEYWQRRLHGETVSLLFTRDRHALTSIAWSEQWTAPCPETPFRFGGAAGPIEAPNAPISALAALTAALGVRGLASADFIDDGDRLWLLEINPRPGATLDVFDDDEDPLMARHLAACADEPAPRLKRRSPRASEIVYAAADIVAPRVSWPDWAADRPAAGARIARSAPICTVSAAGSTVAAAKAEVRARAARIRAEFQERANG